MNLLRRAPASFRCPVAGVDCLARRRKTPDATGTDAPPPGSTVITSDELHSDQVNHTSVFTGKVVVVGTNFNHDLRSK